MVEWWRVRAPLLDESVSEERVGECEPLAFVKLPIKCLEWSKLTLA